jgi:hypothetical protein
MSLCTHALAQVLSDPLNNLLPSVNLPYHSTVATIM